MDDTRETPTVTCSDISPAEPGFFPSNCCDSCHDDEQEGYADLWWDTWLHVCCAQLRALEDAGVDDSNETAVRAFVASRRAS